MKLIAIISVVILILLTACTQTTTIDNTQTTTQETQKVTNTNSLKIVEVKLTNNEMFEPSTIQVKQGDNVRLQFMNTQVYAFSIPAYKISEKVSNNHIDFVADKKGSFSFECSDCEHKNPGLLKVI